MTISIRAKAAAALDKAWAMTDAPEAATVRRVVPGTYNPATGKTDPATTTSYPCTAIIKEYTQNEIKGTSILATDRKVIFPQSQVETAEMLTTSDKFIVGAKTYTIINVGQDPLCITWVLQVRG